MYLTRSVLPYRHIKCCRGGSVSVGSGSKPPDLRGPSASVLAVHSVLYRYTPLLRPPPRVGRPLGHVGQRGTSSFASACLGLELPLGALSYKRARRLLDRQLWVARGSPVSNRAPGRSLLLSAACHSLQAASLIYSLNEPLLRWGLGRVSSTTERERGEAAQQH